MDWGGKYPNIQNHVNIATGKRGGKKKNSEKEREKEEITSKRGKKYIRHIHSAP